MITSKVRLTRPLGEGSMATVWLGDHLALEMQVAVKLLSGEGANDELLERFQREAKAAAMIRSQHVVQIFDYGMTEDSTPYMVLELLEGESLATHLDRMKRMGLEDCDVMVTHVARALTKAHALGIIHRDVKPANIFLTRSEDGLLVKVLDFGVAKQLQSSSGSTDLTADGMLIGTPPYMSPEQILYGSGKLSPQADLWSLAVVAYRSLTGELPFGGNTLDELSLAIFKAAPTRVTTFRPDLPEAIDRFFARAFHKKPDHRFESAQAMAGAFHAVTELVTDEDIATVPLERSRSR